MSLLHQGNCTALEDLEYSAEVIWITFMVFLCGDVATMIIAQIFFRNSPFTFRKKTNKQTKT